MLKLKLKLQYFGHLLQSQFIGKDPDAGKDWGQEEKSVTEDEIVGWYHWLNEHEFQEIVKDREVRSAAVHEVAKRSQLSNWTTTSRKRASHMN